MALQKQLRLASITEAGEQFAGQVLTGTVTLQCWLQEDNPEIDTPVIDCNISARYKKIPKLTIDEQLARWSAAILAQAQFIIDSYLREQVLKNNAKLNTAISNIQNSLTG